MARIALCPEDGHEMTLQHRTFTLDEWHCDACGQYRAVFPSGVARVPEAPLDALPAAALTWVDRDAGPLHGRIDDEEGG